MEETLEETVTRLHLTTLSWIIFLSLHDARCFIPDLKSIWIYEMYKRGWRIITQNTSPMTKNHTEKS